jgi:hypothetical protein
MIPSKVRVDLFIRSKSGLGGSRREALGGFGDLVDRVIIDVIYLHG